jgi:hypothetical protein
MWVDLRQFTVFRNPFPTRDFVHVGFGVFNTVPSIPLKRAAFIVERFFRGIINPAALLVFTEV